jgi:hypothetical protein
MRIIAIARSQPLQCEQCHTDIGGSNELHGWSNRVTESARAEMWWVLTTNGTFATGECVSTRKHLSDVPISGRSQRTLVS